MENPSSTCGRGRGRYGTELWEASGACSRPERHKPPRAGCDPGPQYKGPAEAPERPHADLHQRHYRGVVLIHAGSPCYCCSCAPMAGVNGHMHTPTDRTTGSACPHPWQVWRGEGEDAQEGEVDVLVAPAPHIHLVRGKGGRVGQKSRAISTRRSGQG